MEEDWKICNKSQDEKVVRSHFLPADKVLNSSIEITKPILFIYYLFISRVYIFITIRLDNNFAYFQIYKPFLVYFFSTK